MYKASEVVLLLTRCVFKSVGCMHACRCSAQHGFDAAVLTRLLQAGRSLHFLVSDRRSRGTVAYTGERLLSMPPFAVHACETVALRCSASSQSSHESIENAEGCAAFILHASVALQCP